MEPLFVFGQAVRVSGFYPVRPFFSRPAGVLRELEATPPHGRETIRIYRTRSRRKRPGKGDQNSDKGAFRGEEEEKISSYFLLLSAWHVLC
jgi:hypothetical protein